MTPPSQTYRQVGFRLAGGAQPPVIFNFNLRPEQLSRQEPSRLSVTQTLGGAWADGWGEGLKIITISGHNGWRGGLLASGEDLFAQLRATVFQGWHDRRQQAILSGQDPSQITLTFTDSLDSIRSIVAPRQFLLQRSKSSPLLMRYQITLLELGSADQSEGIIDQILDAINNPLRWIASVTGLGNVIQNLEQYAQLAIATVKGLATDISNDVQMFLGLGPSLLGAITSTAQSVAGSFDAATNALLSVGSAYTAAGANAFAALAADPTLSAQEMIPLMALSSAMGDAQCNIANGFDVGHDYAIYAAMLGASNCSSTGGGDPVSAFAASGVSAFDSLFTVTPPPVSVTAPALAALSTLSADPIPLIGQTALIGSSLSAIAAGVTVTA